MPAKKGKTQRNPLIDLHRTLFLRHSCRHILSNKGREKRHEGEIQHTSNRIMTLGKNICRVDFVDVSADDANVHSGEVDSFNIDDGSGSGTTDADTDITKQQRQQQQHQLGSQETKTVRRLKCTVFTLLFCSMIAVALTAYYFTANEENKEFEAQFYEDANKVLATMGSNLERCLQASDAFVSLLWPR